MFYKTDYDTYINLDHIVKLQDLDGYFKDNSYFYLDDNRTFKYWFGIKVVMYTPGYYQKNWFEPGDWKSVTEDEALYSNKVLRVWYSNSPKGEELEFETEEEKLRFMSLLKIENPKTEEVE